MSGIVVANAVTGWGAVALAWAVSGALVVGYVASLVRRGRVLSRRVAPEDRRWM